MDDARLPFVLLAAVLVLGALFGWRATIATRAWRTRARMARARRGERDAHDLLSALGFEVIATQAPGVVVLHVDGREARFAVRADYLVTRRRQRFVAEVKTGSLAPSLAHGPTRRQLLEYASAFDVDGVLLVDPEARSVREVRFGGAPRPRVFAWRAAMLAAAAVSVATAAMLTR